MLTLQDALRKLTEYWTERGCLSVQPYNTEVGAGTMNPATVLRVLGPEPWNVAYVEPSVRPDDSRYGENPNRLQTHTQFQVILKPEPGDPQELYLGSLEALGIDLRAHDVRFVEDNWAQPAIGAWGLGWEVWLDGMEITQFTYFQQVGGQNLDPIPVELTYGMERIMMALQGVTHFKDIAYAPGVSYGEAFGQSEYEMSRYYLDDADVEANHRLYDTYVAEATRLIEARLPVPAHSYLLKSSHAFNVLDARGAISTTERAKAFGTMRRLARDISGLWVDRREELGFPLLKGDSAASTSVAAGVPTPLSHPETGSAPADLPTAPQTFALEIGVEELPPHVVTQAVDQVTSLLTEHLGGTRLAHGQISVDATPRRIVVTIPEVAAVEPDDTQVRKGPKWAQAYDANGEPTKALQGFLRGQRAELDEVRKVEIGGQEHVGIERTVTGRGVLEVLSELIDVVVGGLRADKNMRWNDPELSYSRAVRWLVALWGPVVVPASVSGLTSGRTTYLHRLDEQPYRAIDTADDLLPTLAERAIVVSETTRREQVLDQARVLAEQAGGVVDADLDHPLVAEIANLVETPVGIRGDFEARYLDLPERILTTVMAKHQRYLPIRSADGALLPHFITMANGECDHEVVRAGNESVLRARYEDALFFWNSDLETPQMDAFVPGLEKLTFSEALGSVGLRARRIADVSAALALVLEEASTSDAPRITATERTTLLRAGALAKFDLATHMVIEMSSLAGFIAREYAVRTGESPEVAQALEEMEAPRTSSDPVPASKPGALLALADRADLLVGLLATGAKATGSSDPFGLRRAALGIVRILRSMTRADAAELTIPVVLETAAVRLREQEIEVSAEQVAAAANFTRERFGQLLRDEGVSAELIAAVRATEQDVPVAVDELLAQIEGLSGPDGAARQALVALVAAVQRISRIVPEGTAPVTDTARFTEPTEVALAAAVRDLPERAGLPEFVTAYTPRLVDAVADFFDDILVMADDPEVKAARLGLLAAVLERVPAGLDWQALDTAVSR